MVVLGFGVSGNGLPIVSVGIYWCSCLSSERLSSSDHSSAWFPKWANHDFLGVMIHFVHVPLLLWGGSTIWTSDGRTESEELRAKRGLPLMTLWKWFASHQQWCTLSQPQLAHSLHQPLLHTVLRFIFQRESWVEGSEESSFLEMLINQPHVIH